jgi:hypothetical protein
MSRAPKRSQRSQIAVDDDEDAARVAAGLLERPLELVHAVVAVRAQLGARQQAAVEDRGVVARVGDDGVAGAEDGPERADVRLVARREDDRVLGAHPLGELALELQVQRRRPVEQTRAGQPGPEAVEGVLRAGDDALVAGEAEVVVRAEHDPLGALHLDHGARRPLDDPEVGQHVGLAGRAQLL